MKLNTRITTVAAALALFIAPATFASEHNTPHAGDCHKQTSDACACMARDGRDAQASQKDAPRPASASEYPLFTDQG